MVPVTGRTWLMLPLLLWVGGSIRSASAALPEFQNAPYVTSIYEMENKEQTLMTLTCTDADAGEKPVITPIAGGMTPSRPCGTCFTILPTGTDGVFDLVFYPKDLPNPTAIRYLIDIQCVSGTDGDVRSTVDVRIKRNTPPYFQNGITYASVPVTNTIAKKAGEVIYTVVGLDDNAQDTVQYTMTTEPATENFEIDPVTGEIKAKTDLMAECNEGIVFKVYMDDGINPTVGPFTVDTTFTGGNEPPELTNLDVEVFVPEDAAAKTTVLDIISVHDKKPEKKLVYTVTASPSSNSGLFEIKNDAVQVVGELDYESDNGERTTELTIQASDGSCLSEEHTLTITVEDVNEPPFLRPEDHTYSVHEGTDYLSRLDIPWVIDDEDENEHHTFKIKEGNNDGIFNIHPDTGQLSLNIDYDIDNGAMPVTRTMTIEVTDKGGETSTTEITLHFTDLNDNAPVIEAGNYAFSVCLDNRNVGATLATMVCTDEDSDYENNNDVYFTGSGNGITILEGGDIVMSVRPALGQTFTTIAYCWDRGIHPKSLKSAGRSVAITSVECPTTTTTTTTTTTKAPTTKAVTIAAPSTTNTYSWFDENLWWIVISALLATALLALLAYMLWTYCCHRLAACEFPRCRCPPFEKKPARPRRAPPSRDITPVERPRDATPDPYLYDFWKERYPDDDYLKMPSRTENPLPITDY